ncbi:MAG: glycosyltransferase family 4 protein [Verrucomicrobia bacterium]|nr:glycosyltransferase family 4 protein [Verrucomicrobiota bacterium]
MHQLASGFKMGDAISNDVLEIQRLLRSWGFSSEIFTDPAFTSPVMRGVARDYREFDAEDNADSVMLFHFSIGTQLSKWYAGLKSRKIIKYHNITPAHFFTATDPGTAERLARGREELKAFAAVPELALAASAYSERELIEAGYRRTGVLPIAINFESLDAPPDPTMLARLGGNAANVLFVGRVTPNKKLEDVIKTFYFFQKTAKLRSRLVFAGALDVLDRYANYLHGLVRELDLRDVIFTRHVTQAELNACYRTAHIFLCMSEHEGFCIPLVEAMHFGVPIVAYAQEAVRETLGGSGVLVTTKNHQAAAEILDLLVSDQSLCRRIIAAQRECLHAFQPEAIGKRLREHLSFLF